MDLERARLRTFLGELEGAGELERRTDSISLGEIAAVLEGHPRAVLFERIVDSTLPLAGNVLGSRARLARAFGVEPRALLPELMRRLGTPQAVVEIPNSDAPVHAVVRLGEDADLTELPVHLQHECDGGPYISAALDFSRDPRDGRRNVGVRRVMLRGRREAGIDLSSTADLPTMARTAHAAGQALPVSIVVGSAPTDYLAGTMKVPGDELALVAALRAAPLAVVKSLTNDILVPADAECVIEGLLEPGQCDLEGPFGEYAGYYGPARPNPILRVTALARRRDAIFQTFSIAGASMHRTDTAHITALRTELLGWRILEHAVREPIAIYAPPATGGSFTVRVAIRPRARGEARNAIAALFASFANVKNVFVCDPDIDIFCDEQFEWALATRFDPAADLVIEGGFRASPIDPALGNEKHTGSKAGFDLTLPFGRASTIESILPAPPSAGDARFGSVEAALQDGPKTFGGLFRDVGSRDGREIVVALEGLRATGRLRRGSSGGEYELVDG